MAALAGKFRSEKQDWATPAEVFAPRAREFCFTLDAAANSTNAKAESFFTETENGLAQDWKRNIVWLSSICLPRPGGWRIGCANPARAAALLAQPSSCSFQRGQTLFGSMTTAPALAEIRFIRGRPKFDSAKHGLPQPLCIAIFRPAS